MSSVWRPHASRPDVFRIEVGMSTLMFIQDGLVDQIETLKEDLNNHDACGPLLTGFCAVNDSKLIKLCGSLDAAAAQGYSRCDCSEMMSKTYGHLSQLTSLLAQMEYVRSRPHEPGRDPDSWDAQAKFRAIQSEVNGRLRSAAFGTQTMPAIGSVADEEPIKDEAARTALDAAVAEAKERTNDHAQEAR